MKILKWLGLFSIAFLFAWILIFTFMQEQFKVGAAARILTWTTSEIPIYLYVAGAFGAGLLLGLFAAFYYYVVSQSKVHRTTKELHEVEAKLADTRRALEQSELSHKPVTSTFHDESQLSDESDEPLLPGDTGYGSPPEEAQ